MKLVNKLHNIFHTTLTNKQIVFITVTIFAYLVVTMIVSVGNEVFAVVMIVSFFGFIFLLGGIIMLCNHLYKKRDDKTTVHPKDKGCPNFVRKVERFDEGEPKKLGQFYLEFMDGKGDHEYIVLYKRHLTQSLTRRELNALDKVFMKKIYPHIEANLKSRGLIK